MSNVGTSDTTCSNNGVEGTKHDYLSPNNAHCMSCVRVDFFTHGTKHDYDVSPSVH